MTTKTKPNCDPEQFLKAKEILIQGRYDQMSPLNPHYPYFDALNISKTMQGILRSVLLNRYSHRCDHGSWSQFINHKDTTFEDILMVLQESYTVRKIQIERSQSKRS